MLRRAIELFNTRGYDATSMGDLAAELGLTKSAIYHHVAGKEALLSAALDEALEGLEAAVGTATSPAGGTSAQQCLRTAIDESVRILLDHLPAVTLLLRVRGNSTVELDALRRRRLVNDQLATLVRAAVAEGSVRDDIPPEVISRLLFGTVNSLVEWYHPEGPVDREQLAGWVTSSVFDGLGQQP